MLQVNQELMRPSSMLPYLNLIYETATVRVHPPPPAQKICCPQTCTES